MEGAKQNPTSRFVYEWSSLDEEEGEEEVETEKEKEKEKVEKVVDRFVYEWRSVREEEEEEEDDDEWKEPPRVQDVVYSMLLGVCDGDERPRDEDIEMVLSATAVLRESKANKLISMQILEEESVSLRSLVQRALDFCLAVLKPPRFVDRRVRKQSIERHFGTFDGSRNSTVAVILFRAVVRYLVSLGEKGEKLVFNHFSQIGLTYNERVSGKERSYEPNRYRELALFFLDALVFTDSTEDASEKPRAMLHCWLHTGSVVSTLPVKAQPWLALGARKRKHADAFETPSESQSQPVILEQTN